MRAPLLPLAAVASIVISGCGVSPPRVAPDAGGAHPSPAAEAVRAAGDAHARDAMPAGGPPVRERPAPEAVELAAEELRAPEAVELAAEEPSAPEAVELAAEEPPAPEAVENAAVDPAPPASSPPAFVLELEPEAGGRALEVPVRVADPGRPEALALEATLGGVALRVLEYEPAVTVLEELVSRAPGEDGFPALRLVVETGASAEETWLVPGSRLLGRAELRTARIECLPALDPEEVRRTEDFLHRLYGPDPKILFESKRDGGKVILPASAGAKGRIADPQYTVEVLRVFQCFALDSATGKAIDQHTQPLNPALEVRIVHAGAERTAWLFSRYPEFSRGAEDGGGLFRFVYPSAWHPHERAEIVIIDAASGPFRAHVAKGGGLSTGTLPREGGREVAGLRLQVAERIGSARIAQAVVDRERGVPAVRIAWSKTAGGPTEERWVPLGAREELRSGTSAAGAASVLIAHLRAPELGAHGRLRASGSGAAHALPGGAPALPPGHPPVRPHADPSRDGSAPVR